MGAPTTCQVLRQCNLSWQDIDAVEMHEAFAAQVLATLRHFESSECVAEFGPLDVEAKVPPCRPAPTPVRPHPRPLSL